MLISAAFFVAVLPFRPDFRCTNTVKTVDSFLGLSCMHNRLASDDIQMTCQESECFGWLDTERTIHLFEADFLFDKKVCASLKVDGIFSTGSFPSLSARGIVKHCDQTKNGFFCRMRAHPMSLSLSLVPCQPPCSRRMTWLRVHGWSYTPTCSRTMRTILSSADSSDPVKTTVAPPEQNVSHHQHWPVLA